MMKIILTFICLTLHTIVVSQNANIDSLLNLLQEHVDADSTRVEILLETSMYYRTIEYEQSISYLKDALLIAQANAYNIQEGIIHRHMAFDYRRIGLLDKALNHALLSLKLFTSLNNEEEILLTNDELGLVYNAIGDYQEALEVHLSNLELVKEMSESGKKGRYYFNVGKSYQSVDSFPQAAKYYQKAADASRNSGFKIGEMIAISTLGALRISTGEYDKARQNFNYALDYFLEVNRTPSIAATYYSMARLSSLENKHEAAILLYNKALELYNTLGSLYFIKDINQKLFIAYSITQETDKAWHAEEIYSSIKDSIESIDRKKIIAEVNAKFETEKKEAEIKSLSQQTELQELQLSQQKYFLAGLFAIIVMILGGGVLIYRQRKLKNQQAITALELKEARKHLEIEQQYRASELKALRSQMNPHFVFNALNSIQEYIMLNERKLAGKYLGKFADLMRIYLYHSQSKSITLAEEVEALSLYLELEKLRFEDTLTYEIKIDSQLDASLITMPSLIIQPHVENALKHGLLHKMTDRQLGISFQYNAQSHLLLCTIKDNGIGRKKSMELNKIRNPHHKSFATEAIKSRLDLLNFDREDSITETIDDLYDEAAKPLGTKVIVSIPMQDFVD